MSAAQLAELRTAWRNRNRAMVELARLKRYRGQTIGMKTDRHKWLDLLSESNATIERILGAPDEPQ
jgi:hypothetical protein